MDVKPEIEVKEEELSPDYDSYEHGSQMFPDVMESIKIEEQKLFKEQSELKELKEESQLNEKQIKTKAIKAETVVKKSSALHTKIFMNLKSVSTLLRKIEENDLQVLFDSEEEEFFAELLKSKFPLVLIRKLSNKELKTLIGKTVQEEEEKGSTLKNTCISKPHTAIKYLKIVKKNYFKEFTCTYCRLIFNSKMGLKRHRVCHRRKMKCNHCGRVYYRKSNLEFHMRTHCNDKLHVFKCLERSYESNQQIHLQMHGLSKHADKILFNCSYCTYKCYCKIDLRKHILTHELFKCSECTYKCENKAQLTAHMLKHKELFKCSECSYSCNSKANFKIHLFNHENNKLFKCLECDYVSNLKGNLKTHMLIHSDAKLLKCSECSYETKKKRDLKIHILKHEKSENKKRLTYFNSYAFVKKKLALAEKKKI